MIRDKALVVRIPAAIKNALMVLAITERRSLSDISNFALREYVEAKSGPITEENGAGDDNLEFDDPEGDDPEGEHQGLTMEIP